MRLRHYGGDGTSWFELRSAGVNGWHLYACIHLVLFSLLSPAASPVPLFFCLPSALSLRYARAFGDKATALAEGVLKSVKGLL